MKSCIKLFSVLVLLAPLVAQAGLYEVSVTRKGGNLYKIDSRDAFIMTKYCYEYVYSEDAILRMNGYSGEIIFDSGDRCDVKAVYGADEYDPGKYSVTVSYEGDDWYEVWETDAYIRTFACLSLALGEEAVLSLDGSGFGTLYLEDDECSVEGMYSRIRLD